MRHLKQSKVRIENIFVLLDCKIEDHIDLLGTSGVSESNIMIYLGIIEEKVQELLHIFAKFHTEKIVRERGRIDD